MRRALVLTVALGCGHRAAPSPWQPPEAIAEASPPDAAPPPPDAAPEVLLVLATDAWTVTVYTDGEEVLVDTAGERRTSLSARELEGLATVMSSFHDIRPSGFNHPYPDCVNLHGGVECEEVMPQCDDARYGDITYAGRTITGHHCVESELTRLEDRLVHLLDLPADPPP